MTVCRHPGCENEATELATRAGVVLAAVCADHPEDFRPLTEYHDHHLTVAERLLVDKIEALVKFRTTLANVKLTDLTVSDMAMDIVSALFGPHWRGTVREHLDEIEVFQ